jgi:hypothetical protein
VQNIFIDASILSSKLQSDTNFGSVNVVHVEETGKKHCRDINGTPYSLLISLMITDRFDSQTNAKEALSLMRMQLGLQSNSTYYKDSRSKFRLHHAVLGRYLGGGIAFIDR